jgi:hypothetical protein
VSTRKKRKGRGQKEEQATPRTEALSFLQFPQRAAPLPTFSFFLFPFSFLAARGEEADTSKVIFGVIFAVIWLLVALMNKLKKKPQQQSPRVLPPLAQQPSQPGMSVPPIPQEGPIPMDQVLRIRREQALRKRQAQLQLQQQQRVKQQSAQRPSAQRPSLQRPLPHRQLQQQQRVQSQPRRTPQPPPLRPPSVPMRASAPAPAPGDPDNTNVPHMPHEATGSLTSTATAFPESTQKQVSASEIRSVPAVAPVRRLPNANAPLISRWLKPSTLRSQFILTEIFQPPVGLREPRF